MPPTPRNPLMRRLLFLSLALLVTPLLLPHRATAADKEGPSRMLFVTQSAGFKHGSVTRPKEGEGKLAPAEVAMIQLGQQSGLFDCDVTQDVASDFTKENLQNYDIVAFYTTLDLPIAEEDLEYFLNDWLKQKGHGFLGFHSAMDTYHNYEPYWDMAGGVFIGHPWGAGTTVTLTVHEPSHPLMKPFGNEFVIKDEIYMYEHWQPEKCRVLMSLNYAKSPVKNAIPTEHGYQVPVAWVKNYGEGKVYCNNLGHNGETWTNKAFLDSITTAVKWMRGDIKAPAEPNPEVSAEAEKKARADFKAGDFTAR